MQHKATAPPLPPPPPPPCGNQPGPPPCPGHAAIPFISGQCPPVQETSPSPETLHHAEDALASPPLPEQNGLESPSSQGQKDNPSDSEEKRAPVQETAPPVTEQQDEAAVQMDQDETKP
ncbi:myosin-binding protein H-like [Micropterus dolomieu]|uniref:myosin-binding protein H-like n=1 Tax=Micropterus dolomieu TaxID=147949 RepID=UPI001E8CCB84|nr:myosin-binding protein H-like [Micropterus dolomieu]